VGGYGAGGATIETPQKFRVIVTGLAHIHFCLRRSSAAPRSGCTLSHWITSSARASTEGGIVRPRAFAVLRLMTNGTFVGS
jgi:hypothetical protein